VTSNPFKQTKATWLVELEILFKFIEELTTIFEPLTSFLSVFEVTAGPSYESLPTDIWKLQLFFEESPNQQLIENILKEFAEHHNIDKIEFSTTLVDDRDWVKQVQENSPPLNIPGYFIYGSHYKGNYPSCSYPILIDAGRAFGSGSHETTSGCLEAFNLLAKNFKFKNMLDMGAGSAILAIAMAKTWKNKVNAVDIDSQAVQIATRNVSINHVKKYVSSAQSNGYKSRVVKQYGPYDLVAANILAKPLVKFAHELRNNLRKNGTVVLAGLLTRQERMVISAHVQQKIFLTKRIKKGAWSILILSKKSL
jgi:ribosomal protein L11 methyltransferase